jgi:phosphoribosylformylglycinamidine synthase
MSASPKHLLHFEGGNALSAFRAQALLARLASASPRIVGVSARHVHWVWSDAPLARGMQDKLAALLAYGEAAPAAAEGALVVVMPRLGTVSPWASKATDIAHNCGAPIHRVERITEFRLQVKSGLLGSKPLAGDELRAAAELLHDCMTESVAFEREAALHLFDERVGAPCSALRQVQGERGLRQAQARRD